MNVEKKTTTSNISMYLFT